MSASTCTKNGVLTCNAASFIARKKGDTFSMTITSWGGSVWQAMLSNARCKKRLPDREHHGADVVHGSARGSNGRPNASSVRTKSA